MKIQLPDRKSQFILFVHCLNANEQFNNLLENVEVKLSVVFGEAEVICNVVLLLMETKHAENKWEIRHYVKSVNKECHGLLTIWQNFYF